MMKVSGAAVKRCVHFLQHYFLEHSSFLLLPVFFPAGLHLLQPTILSLGIAALSFESVAVILLMQAEMGRQQPKMSVGQTEAH